MAEHPVLTPESIFEFFPWLNNLPGIFDLILDMTLDGAPAESIVAAIRQTDIYLERFPGLRERESRGFGAINEAEYIALEDGYRSLLRSFGVLQFFGQTPADFRAFAAEQIGADVSAAEISRRLDRGFAQVADSAPEVKEAFQQFFGFEPTDQQLLLNALDPDRGLREIENQIATVFVGSQALKYGLNITRTRADFLRQSGVTFDIAREGFADIARELPQLRQLAQIQRITPFSQEDLEQFIFHEDPKVIKKRARIFSTALAEFREGSAPSTTRSGGLTQLLDRDISV